MGASVPPAFIYQTTTIMIYLMTSTTIFFLCKNPLICEGGETKERGGIWWQLVEDEISAVELGC